MKPLQTLAHQIGAILHQHGNGIQGGLWLGGVNGAPWYSHNADAIFPTASSIKTFVLVELFAKYRGQLGAPLPGLDAILDDDTHPALAHFLREGREELRRELRHASVRWLGEVLMGKTEVSNLVYNAASNIAIVALGGPVAVTTAIHDRDAAFASVKLNRYMLTDRFVHGDNELAPFALASLYQRLASKQLVGIDQTTLAAIRDVLFIREDVKLGRLYFKDGLLASRPVTIVQAGWWDTPTGPLVFVVMTVETAPDAPEGEDAAAALSQTATDMYDALIAAGYEALPLSLQ